MCAATILAGVACADAKGAPGSTERVTPAVRVDTVFTPEEEMRRFTAGISRRPDRLSNGTSTLGSLASGFVGALAANDTAAVHALRLTRAEFAFLYFGTAPVSRPPYEISPGLLWLQMDSRSTRGARRFLEEYGGARLRPRGVRCAGGVQLQGRNRIHSSCAVTFEHPAGGAPVQMILGSVIERDGLFKVLAYTAGD